MIKLLPCPFCGKLPTIVPSIHIAYVECRNSDCKPRPFSASPNGANDAIEIWNTRTPAAPTKITPEMVEQAENEWLASQSSLPMHMLPEYTSFMADRLNEMMGGKND